jgi:hypothetical protein
MWDLLFSSLEKNPEATLGLLLGTLGIIGGTAVIVGTTWIVHWAEVRRAEQLTALKQVLLERGMSAEEIALVVAAMPGGQTNDRRASRDCGQRGAAVASHA